MNQRGFSRARSSGNDDYTGRHFASLVSTASFGHLEGEHWRLARLEDVLPLELLGAVDVTVVLPAFAGQVLNVDGFEETLGFRPVLCLEGKEWVSTNHFFQSWWAKIIGELLLGTVSK